MNAIGIVPLVAVALVIFGQARMIPWLVFVAAIGFGTLDAISHNPCLFGFCN